MFNLSDRARENICFVIVGAILAFGTVADSVLDMVIR